MNAQFVNFNAAGNSFIESPSPASPREDSQSEETPSVLVQQLTEVLQAGEAVPPVRCSHVYENSTRCRLFVREPYSSFCSRHKKLHPDGRVTESIIKVTADVADFRSAVPINQFLAQLLIAVAEKRVSPRRAAVLGFISNQLLRTLPVIDRELNPPGDDRGPIIINDLPRPIPGYRAGE